MSGVVTFVCGLAGSGKSWFIDSVLKPDWACHEGFMAVGRHEANHRKLVRRLRRGDACAVSELQLMKRYVRDGYMLRLRRAVPDARVRWVFFENRPSKANRNCALRKNKPRDRGGRSHVRMNDGWSPYYEIPARATPRKIHVLRRAT